MYVRKIILSVLPLFLLAPAFALGADLGGVNASEARRELISVILEYIGLISFPLGLLLMVVGAYKLKLLTEEGGKVGFSTPLITILAGAFTINFKALLSVFTNTYFKVDFCQIIDKSAAISKSCFSNEISGLTGDLQQRVARLANETTAQIFIDNLYTIVGIFQVIGFIYFLIGIYGLKEVADGSAENGYGKPLITMIASSLIVDLPHTITTFVDTLEKVGINF
ncbi:TPA: hypothetical protein OTY34_001992 [Pseudomonas aeruginosa]|nr:hypothetical protein [Pseudomonas aeruginosa]